MSERANYLAVLNRCTDSQSVKFSVPRSQRIVGNASGMGIHVTWNLIRPSCQTLLTPRAESISLCNSQARVTFGILLNGAPFNR
jgi:hypothetical protein